jgi:O-acetyl-ADP-ribose deacetylase (regulator of RNase III)
MKTHGSVIRGDLVELALDGHLDFIVHGCNCFHTMGAGIAKQIAEAFPGETGPLEVDKRTPYGDASKLGFVSFAMGPNRVGGTVGIFNAYTQFDIARNKGECVVDYDAVRKAFQHVGATLSLPSIAAEPCRLGFPAIGAGLAGGDWNRIFTIIQEELDSHGISDYTYVEYDG